MEACWRMAEGTVQESRDATRKPIQAGRESNLRSNPRLLGLEERFQLPTIISLRTLSRGALRVARNYKGYSDVQAKVREANSNDPWGPSGNLMNDLQSVRFLSTSTAGSSFTEHDDTETTSLELWRCWANVSMIRAKIGATSLKFVFVLVW